MTLDLLQKIIKEYNIPSDVILESDSGWECSATKMDALYYNKEKNTIVFRQNYSLNEIYYVKEKGWMALDINNDRRKEVDEISQEYDDAVKYANSELHKKALEQGYVFVTTGLAMANKYYTKYYTYEVEVFDDIALTKNLHIVLSQENYGKEWAFTREELKINKTYFRTDIVVENAKKRTENKQLGGNNFYDR